MIRLCVPQLGEEECAAVARVLKSGQLIQGAECLALETKLAGYLDVGHVVVVSSGTAALHMALLALDIRQGDAVLVPDFTFPATANVVELAGAKTVLVDVEKDSYCISGRTLRKAVREWNGPEKLKAIMPVHEFGYPADMDEIGAIAREHNLLVIEDAACALGSEHNGKKIGTFGSAGCFSFHPRKALTTGEGGAISTNDGALAERLRTLRNHGIVYHEGKVGFPHVGLNYRLTDFQAAIGSVQFAKYPAMLQERLELKNKYDQLLATLPVTLPAGNKGHIWQTYMILLPSAVNRDNVIKELKNKGIETNLGAHALHCLDYYQSVYPEQCQGAAGNNAEILYKQGLALPLYPGLTDGELAKISAVLAEILGNS